jgi:hypothetical protein
MNDSRQEVALFAKALGLVAIRTKCGDLDEVKIGAYRQGLLDIPIEIVVEALRVASEVCEFFPALSEIREFADEVTKALRPVQQPLLLPKPFGDAAPEKLYFCWKCKDEGFIHHECREGNRCASLLCQQRRALGGPEPVHTFVRRCACRDSNPKFQPQNKRFHHDPRPPRRYRS